jgi:DNA-binding transcriptional regulator YhcF (GntR family)
VFCGYNEFIMATRRNTDEQVHNLKEILRSQCHTHWTVEAPIPTIRELTQKHGVSTRIVSRALQEMEQEGVLYTVPRVGVFVRSSEAPSSDCYLFIRGEYQTELRPDLIQIQQGFEDAISHLGGASITVHSEQALNFFQNGSFPPLSGVLDVSWLWRNELESAFANYCGNTNLKISLPCVRFGDKVSENYVHDMVSFDDEEGGQKATRHLLSGGHTRIAFLGLHRADKSLSTEQALRLSHELSNWSARRELGWRKAMNAAGVEVKNLAFHPPSDNYGVDYSAETLTGQRVAEQMIDLIEAGKITGVVAANDAAAMGLIHALRAFNVPPDNWPAIVGFDALPQAANNLMTSLRISWQEIGRLAAEILMQRKQGKLTGPPVHRQAPVKLVQRLSSHPQWPAMLTSGLATADEQAAETVIS